MTVLYDNRQRAKRARLSMLAAVVWSIGWFYWANVLRTGGSRPGIVAIVAIVGILPLVALHFYGNVYVVRIVREGSQLTITTLGLFANRDVQVPVSAVAAVERPEASGMTLRLAGRQMPFILDLHAEYGDLNAISALANPDATGKR
jgi:hypothetical protein